MRLKVGDDFLDGDNSIIAQTYAVNEIGDIQTRQGGFSNNFTIPLTSKNKGILEFPEDINSASRNPYTKVDATMFDKGVPVADGYLKYQIVNDTALQASFFADNVNWFNLLKGKKLIDLNLSDFDHLWTPVVIKTAIDADKTTGYTYPLIDYGDLDVDNSTPNQILQQFLLPGMFVSSLIESIFFDIGWKVKGSIIDHPTYKRLFQPFSAKDFVHSASYLSDNIINDTASGLPLAIAASPGGGSFISWTTAGGTDITWNGGTDNIIITLKISLSGLGDPTIAFRVNAGIQDSANPQPPVGTQEYIIVSSEITVDNGDLIDVVVSDFSGPGGNVENTTSINIEATNRINRGGSIQIAATMPDIKQTDLLNYVAFIFGAVLQANTTSKTVTWSFFGDIKKNLADALDWSDKLDISKTREINFTQFLKNYGKVSKFLYKEDSNDTNLVEYEADNNKIFGEGQFDLNNDHLSGTEDVFKTVYSPTINITKTLVTSTNGDTFYVPFIPFYGDRVSPVPVLPIRNNNPTPRILLISSNIDLDTYSPGLASWRITSGPGGSLPQADITAIAFCWLAKKEYLTELDAIKDTLSFDQVTIEDVIGDPLVDRFLIDYEQILNSIKSLEASFHLNEVDISELDFTIPIYLDKYKSYFYISKILNFEGRERVTECELMKIG